MKTSTELYNRRCRRIRGKVKRNNSGRPRLSVYRSSKHIYAQIIDDENGVTVVAASTIEKDLRSKLQVCGNIKAASQVGEIIAQRAQEVGIVEVVFDRGGYLIMLK